MTDSTEAIEKSEDCALHSILLRKMLCSSWTVAPLLLRFSVPSERMLKLANINRLITFSSTFKRPRDLPVV
jgi:hypothetical protein